MCHSPMAFVDYVVASSYRRRLAGPLIEAVSTARTEKKEANYNSRKNPPKPQVLNPGMFVGMFKQIGNKDIERPILSKIVWNREEASSHVQSY